MEVPILEVFQRRLQRLLLKSEDGLGQRLPIMREYQKLEKKKNNTDFWTLSQNHGVRPRSMYFSEESQLPGRWLKNTALNL